MTATAQRVAGVAGAFFVIFSVIGNEVIGRAGEAPVWDDGPAAAVAFAQSQAAAGLFPLAAAFEMLALIALLTFTVALAARLLTAPAGGVVPAGVALAAGVVAAAVKAASGAPVLVAVLRAGDNAPEVTRLLYALNDASFLIMAPFLGAVLAATAVGGRQGGVVPRPLAYLAAPLAVGGVAVPALAASDASFLPVLLMLVWILASGVSLAVRRPAVAPSHPVLT